ncbi:MAG: response regulator [Verrucomicrobiota bacterium]
MKLLHLEDSEMDAELIAIMLQREWPNCEIRRVANAPEYRAAIKQGGFDMILSDYSIPGFDGLSALGLAQEEWPATPFIFLSGTIGEERAVEALKRGATDYVIKDRPNRLILAIQHAYAKLAEGERLRRAEARLREQASLLDRARDAIVATDLEHRIAYWNASAERLYGWKAAEVVGRKLDELGLDFEPVRFAAARQQLMSTGEWRGDFRLRTRAGETVIVESTWSLVSENDGSAPTILTIDTDVTERKKLETQLLRAQRMESIGTLAGGIAHDLNNVLTPILLSIDLFRTKAASPEDRLLMEKTLASATHGAALVQQLLAFARGGEAKRTRVDTTEALRELRTLVRQSLPPSIQLHIHCADRPWAIQADATQFNQVLINLCINARDAMPQGGQLEISVRNTQIDEALVRANPGAKPGPCVQISVIDNGTGIPPAIVDRIFDPFFTTKASGKGTGLGLSMVAGILKSHGGCVQVESELGNGSAFHLFFPAMPESTPAVIQDPPAAPARGQGEAILLVDDEPVVRETLQFLLERAGYRVFAAGDGGSGIRLYDQHAAEIALLITDMMLPDMIGTEVVKTLRRRSPALPVIAISGMMDSGDFDELRHLQPPVDCRSKPLTPQAFLTVVRQKLKSASPASVASGGGGALSAA